MPICCASPFPMARCRRARCDRLADIAERWDRGYGHFTTRQNIQFNWIKLEDTADILAALAEVEMHAIQTSGNCIRNVTTDHWAGAAADEIADPRPVAELLRQWSSLHPEFSYLPRKFKIAVTGAPNDRAAVKVHDIGLRMHLQRRRASAAGKSSSAAARAARRWSAITVRDFLPEHELLPYLEAIMRVYNLYGRRDNKYKARIKILVHGARRRRNSRPRSRRNIARSARSGQPRSTSASSSGSRPISRPRLSRTCRAGRRPSRRRSSTMPRFCPMGPHQCRGPPRSTATASSTSRSSRKAAFPAMPRPTRCAQWPISPSATASTRCGSAITRTSCCRM